MKKYIYLLLAILLVACGEPTRAEKQLMRKAVDAAMEAIDEAAAGKANAEDNNKDEKSGATDASPAQPAAGGTTDWSVVGLPKSLGQADDGQVLTRLGYVASYNAANRIPNWVMWRLTAAHTDGPYTRKGAKFTEDTDVDNSPTTFDYQRTGYDRGHMCPSADNRWSQQAQEECFLMTNICPQNHNLNSGDWSEMEKQCRAWAEQYGEIYIVCGPVLFRGQHKKIAKSIVVPEAFFKVVYCPSRQKAIGFIYRNTEGDRPKGDYVNTVDQVERITGYDFFPSLPAKVQDAMEAEASLEDW